MSTYFHASAVIGRLQNLPSILRGIASDEEIRTPTDLQALNDAATEIETLRRRVAELDVALSQAEWKLGNR